MATVVITDTIRREVQTRITSMFNNQISALARQLDYPALGEFVLQQTIAPETRELVNRLNGGNGGPWLTVQMSVTVSIVFKTSAGHNQRMSFRVSLVPPHPLPLNMLRGDYVFSLTPSHGEHYERVIGILRQQEAVSAERDKLVDTLVRGVLTQCKTLRQVLEVWPSALDFMSDSIRARHAEPTEKRERNKLNVTIDDDVKTSLIKARMVNNANS